MVSLQQVMVQRKQLQFQRVQDQQDPLVLKVLQETLVHKVLQAQVLRVLLDQQDPQDQQVHKVHKVLQAQVLREPLDQQDLQDHLVVLVHRVLKVHRVPLVVAVAVVEQTSQ
tara:strand:+ start:149 stop:484 length:336 start_codon:yes stop_codon:yes gene_type:complete